MKLINQILHIFNKIKFVRHIGIFIIIGVIITASYSPIFSAGFVWDDEEFFLGWKELTTINSIPALLQGKLPEGHEGVYRPIRSIAQLISYQIYGQIPHFYHLQGIIIHLFGALSVFLILWLLLKKQLYAAFGTLLFGLHPVQTEAVAFITASFDTLGIVCLLWSIFFALLYVEFPTLIHHIFNFKQKSHMLGQTGLYRKLLYGISLFLATTAFFTSELTLSLAPMLFIILIVHYKRTLKSSFTFIAPYIIISTSYLVIRTVMVNGTLRSAITQDPVILFLTMTKVITEYFSRLILPINLRGITTISPGILNIYTDTQALLNQKLYDPKTLIGIAIIGFIFLGLMITRKKYPHIFLGIVLGCIALLPVSNIIPSPTVYAERYLYPTFLGIALALSALLKIILENLSQKNEFVKGMIVMGLIIIFSMYFFRIYIRTKDYQTPLTYWLATLKFEPSNKFVLNNIGLSFASLGRFQDALKAFSSATDIDPSFEKANYNLSRVYSELGKYSEAELYASKSFQSDNLHVDYITNYASILAKLGKIRDVQDVLSTSAAKLKDPSIAYFLAVSSIAQNDYETGEDALLQSLLIDPTYTKSYISLGSLYNKLGYYDKTISLFKSSQASLDNKHSIADYYYTLAVAQEKLAAKTEAKESITKAFYANPDDKAINQLWSSLVLSTTSGILNE